MEREELKNIVNELYGMVTNENQGRASELLASVSEGFETLTTNIETLTANNTALTENNEKLRTVNADLFLKVGTPTKKEDTQNQNEGDEIPTFESLFNEKGELI